LYGDFGWPQFRSELIVELERERPEYIAIVRNDPVAWVTGAEDDSLAAFLKFPELQDLVRRDYAFEIRIEDFGLYRRTPSTNNALLQGSETENDGRGSPWK
jgi:hypothetical protein